MNLNNIKDMSLKEKQNTPIPLEFLEKYFIEADQEELNSGLWDWLQIRCGDKPTKEEALAYMRMWPENWTGMPESVCKAISPPKKK
jgi:hypothetical protein